MYQQPIDPREIPTDHVFATYRVGDPEQLAEILHRISTMACSTIEGRQLKQVVTAILVFIAEQVGLDEAYQNYQHRVTPVFKTTSGHMTIGQPDGPRVEIIPPDNGRIPGEPRGPNEHYPTPDPSFVSRGVQRIRVGDTQVEIIPPQAGDAQASPDTSLKPRQKKTRKKKPSKKVFSK